MMAIYRTVSQSFWTDTKVVDCFTPEDKYFWLYLLTNPHTNLLGCYEISVKQISNETGYTHDSVRNLLTRFVEQYKIIDYSEADKEILVKNWYKYNWTKSPKALAGIKSVYPYIKCERFKIYLEGVIEEKFGEKIRASTETEKETEYSNREREQSTDVSIRYTYPIHTVSDRQNAQIPPSKMYGVYKNVILTDEELGKLKEAYPSDYEAKIDRLSVYIKQTGKHYDNHYAVLTAWAKEDETKNRSNAHTEMSSFKTDSFFEAAMARSYGEATNTKEKTEWK